MPSEFAAVAAVQFPEFQGGVGSAHTPGLHLGLIAVEVFLDGTRAADVLQDDAFLLLFADEVVTQEGNDEVGADETSLLVDEGDAVGIAVEEQADVTLFFQHQGLDLFLGVGLQRVRLMVGEVTIQGVVDVMRLADELVGEDGRHAIAAVHSDVEVVVRSDKALLESEIVGIDIPLTDLAFLGAGHRGFVALHQGFQAVQAGVVAHGKGIFGGNLEAVMAFRVV